MGHQYKGWRSEIERALDDLQRLVLFLSENSACFVCGNKGFQVAHIYGRRYRHTRWDVAKDGNCHILCGQCHHLDHMGLLDPSYRKVFEDKFGKEMLYSIHRRSREIDFMLNVQLLSKLADMRSYHAELLGLDSHSEEYESFLPENVRVLLEPTDE